MGNHHQLFILPPWLHYQSINLLTKILKGIVWLPLGRYKRVENHCTFTSNIYKLWEAIGDIPSQRYSLAAVSQPDNRIGLVGGENDRRKYSSCDLL